MTVCDKHTTLLDGSIKRYSNNVQGNQARLTLVGKLRSLHLERGNIVSCIQVVLLANTRQARKYLWGTNGLAYLASSLVMNKKLIRVTTVTNVIKLITAVSYEFLK